jgi:hypothetical protein
VDKKYKELREEFQAEKDNPFVYLVTIQKDGEGTIITDIINGKKVVHAFSNTSSWIQIKSLLDAPEIKSFGGELSYNQLSLGETVDFLRKQPECSMFIIHEVQGNHIENYSIVSLSDLENMMMKNGRAYVPQWILDLRK